MARIDTDKLPAMGRKFDVKGLPTVWFLDDTGQPPDPPDGFVGRTISCPCCSSSWTSDYEWTDYSTWREHRK